MRRLVKVPERQSVRRTPRVHGDEVRHARIEAARAWLIICTGRRDGRDMAQARLENRLFHFLVLGGAIFALAPRPRRASRLGKRRRPRGARARAGDAEGSGDALSGDDAGGRRAPSRTRCSTGRRSPRPRPRATRSFASGCDPEAAPPGGGPRGRVARHPPTPSSGRSSTPTPRAGGCRRAITSSTSSRRAQMLSPATERSGGGVPAAGEPFPYSREVTASRDELARRLRPTFADAVASWLPATLQRARGVELRLASRRARRAPAGTDPAFEEVRQRIELDYALAQRERDRRRLPEEDRRRVRHRRRRQAADRLRAHAARGACAATLRRRTDCALLLALASACSRAALPAPRASAPRMRSVYVEMVELSPGSARVTTRAQVPVTGVRSSPTPAMCERARAASDRRRAGASSVVPERRSGGARHARRRARANRERSGGVECARGRRPPSRTWSRRTLRRGRCRGAGRRGASRGSTWGSACGTSRRAPTTCCSSLALVARAAARARRAPGRDGVHALALAELQRERARLGARLVRRGGGVHRAQPGARGARHRTRRPQEPSARCGRGAARSRSSSAWCTASGSPAGSPRSGCPHRAIPAALAASPAASRSGRSRSSPCVARALRARRARARVARARRSPAPTPSASSAASGSSSASARCSFAAHADEKVLMKRIVPLRWSSRCPSPLVRLRLRRRPDSDRLDRHARRLASARRDRRRPGAIDVGPRGDGSAGRRRHLCPDQQPAQEPVLRRSARAHVVLVRRVHASPRATRRSTPTPSPRARPCRSPAPARRRRADDDHPPPARLPRAHRSQRVARARLRLRRHARRRAAGSRTAPYYDSPTCVFFRSTDPADQATVVRRRARRFRDTVCDGGGRARPSSSRRGRASRPPRPRPTSRASSRASSPTSGRTPSPARRSTRTSSSAPTRSPRSPSTRSTTRPQPQLWNGARPAVHRRRRLPGDHHPAQLEPEPGRRVHRPAGSRGADGEVPAARRDLPAQGRERVLLRSARPHRPDVQLRVPRRHHRSSNLAAELRAHGPRGRASPTLRARRRRTRCRWASSAPPTTTTARRATSRENTWPGHAGASTTRPTAHRPRRRRRRQRRLARPQPGRRGGGVGRAEHARQHLRRVHAPRDLRDERPAHHRALLPDVGHDQRLLRRPELPVAARRRRRRADGRHLRAAAGRWRGRTAAVRRLRVEGHRRPRAASTSSRRGSTAAGQRQEKVDTNAVDPSSAARASPGPTRRSRRPPTFYYARVLQTPTPRWSVLRLRGGSDARTPPAAPTAATSTANIQERAWTSPIWYLP